MEQMDEAGKPMRGWGGSRQGEMRGRRALEGEAAACSRRERRQSPALGAVVVATVQGIGIRRWWQSWKRQMGGSGWSRQPPSNAQFSF